MTDSHDDAVRREFTRQEPSFARADAYYAALAAGTLAALRPLAATARGRRRTRDRLRAIRRPGRRAARAPHQRGRDGGASLRAQVSAYFGA